MFMLKLLIGISAIIISVKIGIDRASKNKRIYYFFNSVEITCDKFISDISYKKSNVNSVLKGKYPSNEYNLLIDNFTKNNKLVLPNFLSIEEKLLIEDMFNSLGKMDSEAQTKYILSIKNQIKKISNEKLLNYKKFYNLSIKLGFIFGLFIFIMVI